METAAFRLEGRRGSYASVVGRLEWAPTDDLSLRARIPIDSLTLEGDEEVRSGLGDAELRVRVQLQRSEPLKISGGWVTQLPTGSSHAGLGAGAVQAIPFLNAGYKVDRTILYVTVAGALSLKETRTVDYVDPSSDHEIRTTLGSIFVFTEAVAGSVIVTETTTLDKVEPGHTRSLLTGALQLGTQPDRRLRLVVAQQLPLLGEERFSWKLNVTATYAF
jgi:hypothetical protein